MTGTGIDALFTMLACDKPLLVNIKNVLTTMVETWETQAASLENEDEILALGLAGAWGEVRERQHKAVATRACAAHLKAYLDTWAEP